MLVHLVQNKQLKKPLKKHPPLTYLLTDINGQLYLPVALMMQSNQFNGMPLATFEMAIGKSNKPSMLITAKSFNELLSMFKGHFIPGINPNDIRKVLQSQSLTIKYVIEQLRVPRTDAKEFIEKCVSVGAFKKYYSYWVRTDIFASWMTQHEETL